MPRWTELLETKLQKAVLAGQSADPQRITASVDDLSSLSSRTLADAGGSRGCAGRTVGRITCLEDAEGPSADADDPTAAINAAAASTPRQVPSEASRYIAAYMADADGAEPPGSQGAGEGHAHPPRRAQPCLLYTSDAADE